jgi:hypothetical protein
VQDTNAIAERREKYITDFEYIIGY